MSSKKAEPASVEIKGDCTVVAWINVSGSTAFGPDQLSGPLSIGSEQPPSKPSVFATYMGVKVSTRPKKVLDWLVISNFLLKHITGDQKETGDKEYDFELEEGGLGFVHPVYLPPCDKLTLVEVTLMSNMVQRLVKEMYEAFPNKFVSKKGRVVFGGVIILNQKDYDNLGSGVDLGGEDSTRECMYML